LSAIQIINATLENSLGCSVIGPNLIQFVFPFTEYPSGEKVNRLNKQAVNKIGKLNLRKCDVGILKAINAAETPIIKKINCLKKIV
jgi:hypothetical protein